MGVASAGQDAVPGVVAEVVVEIVGVGVVVVVVVVRRYCTFGDYCVEDLLPGLGGKQQSSSKQQQKRRGQKSKPVTTRTSTVGGTVHY